jgi:hypothetical protein
MSFLPAKSFVLALLVVLSGSPVTALTVTTNRTFSVQPGGHLVIDADRGSIRVLTAATNSVSITVEREVNRSTDEKARDVLASHAVDFRQEGEIITVKARLPKSDSIWSRKAAGLTVKYTVNVPKAHDLTLTTAGGSVDVGDIAGRLKLETAGGSIHVAALDGSVKAETAGGSISVASATGAVDVDSAGGSIQLGSMKGTVQATSAGGSVRVDAAAGPVKARTNGGSIIINQASAPIQADTAGGSVTARFVAAPAGDSQLECTGGGITVYVADALGFAVDAESTGGGVRTELPVAGDRKASRTSLRGQLNGGGPALKLRSVGGGISLRRLAAKGE